MEISSLLTTEQTKFLGGDVEHTHLVKGLDYALLRKIREQEKEQHEIDDESAPNSKLEKNLSQSQNKTVNIGSKSGVAVKKEGFKDFRTSSVMAETLKKMMHNPDSVLNISRNSSVSKVEILLKYEEPKLHLIHQLTQTV